MNLLASPSSAPSAYASFIGNTKKYLKLLHKTVPVQKMTGGIDPFAVLGVVN
jgi:hypothetical protein